MEPIALPELYCPFEPEISPYADDVYEGTIDWACGFGVVSEESAYRKIDIGQLAGRYHPYAEKEVLGLISDVCGWFFFRDDWCDESDLGKDPKRLEHWDRGFLRALEGNVPDEDSEPLSFAIHDLGERLRAKAPSALWMRRFVRSVHEHFGAQWWEATNRVSGEPPNIATFIKMRRRTGGLYVDSDLIELADDIRLSPEVMDHPTVRSLREASMDVVVWFNDLISLPRELQSGEGMHNLVFVVQHLHELTLQEAVAHVAVMHDARVRFFMELERTLPSFGTSIDVEVQRYVRSLRARMRGNMDWSYLGLRYHTAPFGVQQDPATAQAAIASVTS